MRKDNGKPTCRGCFCPIEYAKTRRRRLRHTGDDGLVTETMEVVIGRCPEDGRYSTVYGDEMVKGRHYCISDIRCALDRKSDYSLASPRTKAYWRSWIRKATDLVIQKIVCHIDPRHGISPGDVSESLASFLKSIGDGWLRYLLDLFYAECDILCTFLDLIAVSIHDRGGEVRERSGRLVLVSHGRAGEPP